MTIEQAFFLYVVAAIGQAILVARLMRERTAPGLLVIVLTIMAPVVSVFVMFELIARTVKFLVTYKND